MSADKDNQPGKLAVFKERFAALLSSGNDVLKELLALQSQAGVLVLRAEVFSIETAEHLFEGVDPIHRFFERQRFHTPASENKASTPSPEAIAQESIVEERSILEEEKSFLLESDDASSVTFSDDESHPEDWKRQRLTQMAADARILLGKMEPLQRTLECHLEEAKAMRQEAFGEWTLENLAQNVEQRLEKLLYSVKDLVDDLASINGLEGK
jgi:hypothetical protein